MEKIDNIVTYKYVNFKNEIFYILGLIKITNIDFVSEYSQTGCLFWKLIDVSGNFGQLMMVVRRYPVENSSSFLDVYV
jgi:hypothetical protein